MVVISYSPENKDIFIFIYRRKQDKNIAIVIEDSGPSVPPHQLTMILIRATEWIRQEQKQLGSLDLD